MICCLKLSLVTQHNLRQLVINLVDFWPNFQNIIPLLLILLKFVLSFKYFCFVVSLFFVFSFSECLQTERRTDVHEDRQTDRREARQTRQKQRQEAEDNRRETRDKTGDKDGGAVWSTATRTAVGVGGWLCGGRVALLCVVVCCCVLLCVVRVVLCVVFFFFVFLCLFCWCLFGWWPPFFSSREVAVFPLRKWPETPRAQDTKRPRHKECQRHQDNTWGQHGARRSKTCVFNVCLF